MQKMWRAGLAVAATGLLVTTIGIGTAAADDWGGSGGSIEGHGTSFGSSDFHASNDSGDPLDAQGYYRGVSPGGPLFILRGPITCLDVQDREAGFIYRIDDPSSPPVFDGMEVKVSISDGGDGGQDKIKFDFPQPAGSQHECAPDLAGASDFHGELTVDPDDHGDD